MEARAILEYTGIRKHKEQRIGLFDTVVGEEK